MLVFDLRLNWRIGRQSITLRLRCNNKEEFECVFNMKVIIQFWSGCFFYITPVFSIIGFSFSFTFGGFTGLIIASCIIDNLSHDTHSVIGHFHYVLSSGAVYTIFASIYNYINLLTSITYNELLGRLNYTLFFISSNLIFLSMHILGINSFPRRIFDYSVFYLSINHTKYYGILSSIVNGFNLIISQFPIPKMYIHYWFQAFPIAFLLFSLSVYNIIFPFLFIDLYLSFIILLLLSGLSISKKTKL